MNFHLADGIYFRRNGDELLIVRADDFNDPGEVLVKMDIASLASIVASASPLHEQYGSWDYIMEFLNKGTMYCGGCGCRMAPGESMGTISVVNVPSCKTCFEQKFKPLFDWGKK